jgi:glycosyltransferase involved in cell wall biosynthesis
MSSRWTIALDATYSLGEELSGIGVYCREILSGLAAAWPEQRFLFCYRPHRFLAGLRRPVPPNCHRGILWGSGPHSFPHLFHGLNQRMPVRRFPRAVSTFHDLFVLTAEYSTAEFRRRFAQQARQAAERSDLIIAVSEFTAAQVRDLLGVESSRLRVVPHGVHPPATPPTAARENFVLHVGAIQKRKNLSRLVRAFTQMPPGWRLVLAGSSGFGAGEIFGEIARSPRRADIEVTGYVPKQRLEELYSRAAILAFPSLDEGFGMPVLEAMAHRLPVLTSNRSALPEVAGDAAILVDPFDEEAIAAGLRRLASNEDLRLELAGRAFHRAAQYPWRRAVQQTREVYKELLG